MLEPAALDQPRPGRRISARPRVGRLLAIATLWVLSLGAMSMTALLITSLVPTGIPELCVRFLFEAPRSAGLAGGISSVLVSTALLVGVCLATALPISLLAGAYLAAQNRRNARGRRLLPLGLDMLASLPPVVFGLFGNALFCRVLGLGFSLLSGGLTLACMVLPIMVRANEQALVSVPRDYHAACTALGLSDTKTLFWVQLPAARAGIVAGTFLATGRALSETAALIFTSGYVTRMPRSLMDSGRSMSVHIYDLAMNVPGGGGRASATALLLVGLILFGGGLMLGQRRPQWRVD
jgi:phosphate transport system permease protein